ncbi:MULTISPECIES: thiamine pyrophosphate-dependent enzyme [unclassified Imperialibacter]|uniref:alpha-ketoacid dehydrogenase subunit alpha/beta n=1 Tax=unclassified Imperialibacter TaxID=2629706 RepID=UPI001259F924|nr:MULTISPECIES: alpha-ketoacid dehydrogenase subunit alpha/beta [unclassified Imperialibacter]CAD5278252.1 Branched-chain alpha-keto acid dehydrogenase, E1 component, alpha subunit [Imperialibacter sp. 89]CAD5292421.1 Branched-chain alpha-keto acid dehydrogenase, E1 component, alpha subunit [Imperialibacter sp. 75]VVS99811.1 Branched-chain alpha-keto acid dehydrogenase, E1 component, alpha subunit [Imperialibacter sp. EC-SDR9]
MSVVKTKKEISVPVAEILDDYLLVCESREASLMGRKEVFMGKAKFGIFGDGKELAQVAMAKVFKNGDFRSGYYRDQTFMMAIGQLTIQQFFAQLYAHTDLSADPSSGGRLMNSHFSTRYLNEKGEWKTQTDMKNSSSDISCTAGQMPRLLGLAYASKLYRNNPALKHFEDFSIDGNEVAWGTIGNASTSEGHFFETINAGGVLQVPMVISIWDDEYGISVPAEYHTTKSDISKVLAGFQRNNSENGYEIIVVNGWDYEKLVQAYRHAGRIARDEHVPVLVHVKEMTQPQGHSTSGSQERYKSRERLDWEEEFDCIKKFREWILENEMATLEHLERLEENAREKAKADKNEAWKAYVASIKEDLKGASNLLANAAGVSKNGAKISAINKALEKTLNPLKMDVVKAVKRSLYLMRGEKYEERQHLINWLKIKNAEHLEQYSSHLYSESEQRAVNVKEVAPVYNDDSVVVDGREVLQAFFDHAFSRDPRIFAIGEDVGQIGDVNQGFAGLQAKHGEIRVTDTGIRESTIIGQGIGAAMRGLKPIAEVQYLDYLIFTLQTLSDDLATLQYRTKGGQKAPVIIRTRGHRLEGVWHSGSPMSMIMGSLRGIYLLVPRNMTKAAGFYNTLLASDDTAIVIECLNGYRLKERLPENIDDIKTPLGVPEVIREGSDVTIVTYGSMCRIVMEAAELLEEYGVSCEVVDVQSLMPFDLHHSIVESLKKTNRIIFADEDVPGGASAYMMQKVLEEQGGYKYLDSQPGTITSAEHRPAYSSDGDYFSKPNVENVFDKVYELMAEADPEKYPEIFN